jgi:formate hydrogenlyase subunit 6/NADH:ubiquinone oxidoreductase subunit I
MQIAGVEQWSFRFAPQLTLVSLSVSLSMQTECTACPVCVSVCPALRYGY